MNGYLGKLLFVDLSSADLADLPLNDEFARAFVGGSGLAARYLFDRVGARTDPLGPENPLIFMTGPLVGTAMPGAGRYSVCALSPLTGIWGESNAGGTFGPTLRFAGYDGIIITGQAAEPVWLSITDGHAELHDAADLWGCDTYATQQRIRALLGAPAARVACIGLAGEKLARMAAVINDRGDAAGRTGMGAVMGSKKLKAIAVRGNRQVPVADPGALEAAVQAIGAYLATDMATEAFRLAGTASYVDVATLYGDMNGGFNPIKDLYKTQVYALARYRNRTRPKGCLGPDGIVVPENVLTKAPTAELKPGQRDQDILPPYEVLDDILTCLVEQEMPLGEIVKRGHPPELVKKVERMLYLAEYKRRQAAPGVKITARNFGRDRRYPITNKFREKL